MNEKEIVERIKGIIDRGNSAEVKQKMDGSVVVYEVKKKIVKQ